MAENGVNVELEFVRGWPLAPPLNVPIAPQRRENKQFLVS